MLGFIDQVVPGPEGVQWVFPAAAAWWLGKSSLFGLYVLSGVIRLVYLSNVGELKQDELHGTFTQHTLVGLCFVHCMGLGGCLWSANRIHCFDKMQVNPAWCTVGLCCQATSAKQHADSRVRRVLSYCCWFAVAVCLAHRLAAQPQASEECAEEVCAVFTNEEDVCKIYVDITSLISFDWQLEHTALIGSWHSNLT